MNTFQVSNGLPAKSQQSVPYCLQLGKIEMLLIENIFICTLLYCKTESFEKEWTFD